MKYRIQRTLSDRILYAAWLAAKAGKYDLARRWLGLLETQAWT